ncbi:MAG: DoxX family protein [Saprospiraceae bacterium]
MKDISDLIGRIFISIIFFYEILETIFFYTKTKELMTDYGLTWAQDSILIFALIITTLGALLVAFGYSARFGAFLLLLSWIPYTLIVYPFWNDAPDLQRESAQHFLNNLAILGGLFLLIANGSGRYSVRRLIHVMRLPK